jgi:hypothetical protein
LVGSFGEIQLERLANPTQYMSEVSPGTHSPRTGKLRRVMALSRISQKNEFWSNHNTPGSKPPGFLKDIDEKCEEGYSTNSATKIRKEPQSAKIQPVNEINYNSVPVPGMKADLGPRRRGSRADGQEKLISDQRKDFMAK